MKRRDFHKTAGALMLLPALPATAAASAPASAHQIAWASAISKAQGARAPALVAKFVNLDLRTASSLCAKAAPRVTRLSSWLERSPPKANDLGKKARQIIQKIDEFSDSADKPDAADHSD